MEPSSLNGNGVRVGVLLTADGENNEGVIIAEECNRVDYLTERGERTSFSFDAVATLDNAERLYPEFLQPVTGLVSTGCHRNVLVGGASRSGKDKVLGGQGIIKQLEQGCPTLLLKIYHPLVMSFFNEINKERDGGWLCTVSFVQFYPDDSTVDLLNPEKQKLSPLTHPVMGIVVVGLSEIVVQTAEEAIVLYERGREMKQTNSSLHTRCSSLFSLSIERRLHTDEARDQHYSRSCLRLFDLAGGARKGDLSGVSPLVKVLELIETRASPGNRLLPLLLMDSLAGGCETFLLYCIQPQGLLDEDFCGLALAQRIRGLVTPATLHRHCGKWSPQAAAREIREQIQDQRTKMLGQSDCDERDTSRLEELIRALQVVKDQDWEKRRQWSEEIVEKRKQFQASSMVRMPGHTTDQQGETERRAHLQEQLREETEAHMREGKVGVEESQRRLDRIQQLRAALGREEHRSTVTDRETDQSKQGSDQSVSGSAQLSEVEVEYTRAQNRRKRLMEEHHSVIEEALAKMERDLGTEKVDGPEGELLRLGRERQVLVLQMEALHRERQEAERDLETSHRLHIQYLHSVREESVQVFRVFRQVFEEQGEVKEERYRTLLVEAIQDAVYLSAQNQQLQAENKQLRRDLAELKDALSVRNDLQERVAVALSLQQ